MHENLDVCVCCMYHDMPANLAIYSRISILKYVGKAVHIGPMRTDCLILNVRGYKSVVLTKPIL